VSILWYVVKKAFPDEVRDLRFFLTFIIVIVPFVLTVWFGLAIINYDVITIGSGWPPALPLRGSLSPPIIGAVIFYVGQTLWLWSLTSDAAMRREGLLRILLNFPTCCVRIEGALCHKRAGKLLSIHHVVIECGND